MTEFSLTTETRYGSMDVLRAEGDIVSRFLLRYGEWSELEVQFVSANIPESARIADVGAFVGSFGISLSQKKALEKVFFVEANSEIVPLLCQNVKRNCRAPHQVLDTLIFPRGQTVKVVKRYGANQGSVSYNPESDADVVFDTALPKSSTGLDVFLKEHGPFDLLKLDIEGLELEVLKDIEAELSSGAVSVWAECNEAQASLQLAEFLLSCGLKVHYFAFPSFNPNNFRRETEAIFPMAYEAGLYASRDAPAFPDLLRQAGCLCHEIKDRESLKLALWRTPRWCPSELSASQLEETAAIAIRYLSGERYATFLAAPDNATDNLEGRRIVTPLALTEALERLEHEFRTLSAERDSIADDRDAMKRKLVENDGLLEQVRNTHAKVVDQLNSQISLEREHGLQQARLAEWAQALAQDRLAILRTERQLRFETTQQIAEITSRRSWRALNLMLRPMTRHPAMYRAARVAWGGAGRLARYFRIKR